MNIQVHKSNQDEESRVQRCIQFVFSCLLGPGAGSRVLYAPRTYTTPYTISDAGRLTQSVSSWQVWVAS